MSPKIIYRPAAEADLRNIYSYIAQDSRDNALRFVERIRLRIDALAEFPNQGTRCDHVRPGLRTFGFERRVTIVFHLVRDRVEVLRVLYGGRDLERAMRRN